MTRIHPVSNTNCDCCNAPIDTNEYMYVEEYDHMYLKQKLCQECYDIYKEDNKDDRK